MKFDEQTFYLNSYKNIIQQYVLLVAVKRTFHTNV